MQNYYFIYKENITIHNSILHGFPHYSSLLLIPRTSQKVRKLLHSVEMDEQQLYKDNTLDDQLPVGGAVATGGDDCDKSPVSMATTPASPLATLPPAPRLLCRTDKKMVLTPIPFTPVSGQKVSSSQKNSYHQIEFII